MDLASVPSTTEIFCLVVEGPLTDVKCKYSIHFHSKLCLSANVIGKHTSG